MESIDKGYIVLGDGLHYTSEGEPHGPLIPQDLFKPEAECGIGEIFMGIGEDGEPTPMMKIDKQWIDDMLKFWYAEY